MITEIVELKCDKCGKTLQYINAYQTHVVEQARKDGWAVSRDRHKHYCPTDCARWARQR